MKLSVIIPLYNAELYVGKCVDSLLNCDLDKTEYEVIVVDDGSEDNGLTVVREYAERFSNILVFHQENHGQGVARNNAIKEAKGDYLWFVDADDYINTEFSKIISLIDNHPSLDIIAVQLVKTDENGDCLGMECSQHNVRHNVIMKGRDAVISGYYPSSVAALIVKRSLIERYNLVFDNQIKLEDVELSYRLMSHAGNVMFTDIAPYVYVTHQGSTSKAIDVEKKIKYIGDEIVVMQSFNKLAHDFRNSDPELSDTIENHVKNMLFGMVLNLHRKKPEWSPLGINDEMIRRLKVAGMYPITVRFDDWMKNVFKHLLNCEWFVK